MSHLLIRADARRLPLADRSVRCCVCSPPFWGLRDYGTGQWLGGDPTCKHDNGGKRQVPQTKHPSAVSAIVTGGNRGAGNRCILCEAIRIDAQLGLEPTPDAYVANMVAVFREVRRVLADDGTLWLNLGDSYAVSGKGGNPGPDTSTLDGGGVTQEQGMTRPSRVAGLKPKDLVGIPWMVAFALRADGWYLRSEIIWHKPNPMPESVTDRPTKAHEQIFLLSKGERYFYDADAIKEPMAKASVGRYAYAFGGAKSERLTAEEAAGPGTRTHPIGFREVADGRNLRSVWTIATHPFPGAHFATFPPEIPERCIQAGSRPGDLILDPFGGAMTTVVTALALGRRAVGLDLSRDYLAMASRRINRPHARLRAPRPAEFHPLFADSGG